MAMTQQMPDVMSRIIHDFIRPDNKKAHKKMMNIMIEEINHYNTMRDTLLADGCFADDIDDEGLSIEPHVFLTLLGFPYGWLNGVIYARYMEEEARIEALNWAYRHHGEPFKYYEDDDE